MDAGPIFLGASLSWGTMLGTVRVITARGCARAMIVRVAPVVQLNLGMDAWGDRGVAWGPRAWAPARVCSARG